VEHIRIGIMPPNVTSVSFHWMNAMMANDARIKMNERKNMEILVLKPSWIILVSFAILERISPVF